ncbi:MAG: c-type cytochrome [Pikeienuella sp.]|uniref:c-type cytochrome n=1 Tax=Pikeienuella sp. TaxID=2831957 RepID=UPI00391C887D
MARARYAFLTLVVWAAGAAAEHVDYVVENASAIPDPLAEWTGGPEPGAALWREAGCAECHQRGRAPALEGAGSRLTAGEIRLMIVEPRVVYPETEMPAYYTPGLAGEVEEALVGRTRLTALEIEQLVAFLLSGAAN